MTVLPPLAVTALMTGANIALTAMREFEGPRLADTRATVADYGTPLNYFVGQRVLPCPCFFAKPILEKKKKRKGKGGKQTTYTGFGTWAVHVADHAIAGVAKIWFDNHLVFDATGGEEKIYPLADDYELSANMRVYLGSEDQEPDPDMLAYVEARDGPGTCPAYRRQGYVYFENVPLEMLGNRYPDVKMLTRTASPVEFQGWYARFRMTIINPSTDFRSWWVEPDNGGRVDNIDVGSFYPNGVPRAVSEAGDTIVTGYFVNAGVMDAQELWLRHQFSAGTVGPDMRVLFQWQFWNGEWTAPMPITSTIIDPGKASDSGGNPFDVVSLWPWDWFFAVDGSGVPAGSWDAGDETVATLEQLLTFVSARAGLDQAEYDWSAATQEFVGYNWTQGTGKQILEAVLDLFDTDVRPHDFLLEALPRGGASQGSLPTGEFVPDQEAGAPYVLPDTADRDLPRRVFLTYADAAIDQNPNVAQPVGPDAGAAGTEREMSIDMQTLALTPDDAQRLAERRLRRQRFGRITAGLGLTRRRIGIEPGDVWTPVFDGDAIGMRCTKVEIGADGRLATEWERDSGAIAILSGSTGAGAAGYVPDLMPDDIGTLGAVLDLPLLIDAHEQAAPLAYLVAGPGAPGVWTGADFAQSETGAEGSFTVNWDGIAASEGAVIGECAGALPDALPWVPDNGSVVTVAINVGELTAATLDDLLADPTRNLAAIESGDGWELVQFMTPTLVDVRTYAITGFLRGVRGTEWAMAGHAAGDRFVLLDSTARLRTMGAAEIGDTDWYAVSATGAAPVEADAFALAYTGASHKPLAPVHGSAELDGNDWLFGATRRTRIGGGSLDNQDVPLGQASESWSLDILDSGTPVRTITGTSLPLTYAEADQITDFGSPQSSVSALLHQVDPVLNLRGYPLAISA